MGKRKLWGVMLIVTALVIMQLPVSEADAAASASDFQMNGSTLVKYVGKEKAVTIPSTVEKIGRSAFEENDTIQSIVIPESVKKIEEYAFWGCDRLNSVTLGKGLTEVGDYVFANCKGLTSVTIPSNVHSIGIYAFEDCVNLQDITIPPQVVDIHETAFDGCFRLVIHAEEGTYADRYAQKFAQRQAEMPEYEDIPTYSDEPEVVITIPQGEPSVSDNQITAEPEGYSVREEGNLLGSTRIVGNRAVVFIDNTSPTVLDAARIPQTQEPGAPLEFTSDGSLPKYTIVDGRIVADQAYYRSSALTDIALPGTIEEIGEFAFARSSLTSVELPESLRIISYGAFYHCDRLAEVSLPDSVENVEPKAFAYTQWMQNFQNSSDEFLISGKVLVAYKGTNSQVMIPDGVTVIAAEAFEGNARLEQVILPDSLQVIGEGAFENCTSLREVSFGQNIQKIKDRAFAGCALTEEVLPASLTEQGLQAFDDNVSLQYAGNRPDMTHEVSAERLSNEAYRNVSPDTEEAGVYVRGVENAYAFLSGASRAYILQLDKVTDVNIAAVVRRAFERVRGNNLPQSMVLYQMQLYDNSQIALTKLGKQELTVILPVTEELRGDNLRVAMLDRNGQLETVACERVVLEGEDCIRFRTEHPSCFAVYSDGTAYDGESIVEESVEFLNMSAAPAGAPESHIGNDMLPLLRLLKWSMGVALLLIGASLTFKKNKKR
ncbi:MAG: leucine-rich repeat domain-containing protein [Lachnospiraceae bacterium]|nr:leucine-rich repeat domain-containing protein [Lachnospiraceae bacterium]